MNREWLEKSLEKYVLSNMDELSKAIYAGTPQKITLLGSQIKCRYGIMDILCHDQFNVYVVECKAVEADESVVGQAMRYCNSLEYVLNPYFHLPDALLESSAEHVNYHIGSIIIAPSFCKKLRGSNCILIQATHKGDGQFSLERYAPEMNGFDDTDLEEMLIPFAQMIADRAVADLRKRKLEEATHINVWAN
jgi:hypothetical protein